MQEKLIEIRDIGLLTILTKINNIQPREIKLANTYGKPRLVYYFEPHQLGGLADDYFQHKCMVEAREFAGSLKKMKQEIYSEKITLSEGKGNVPVQGERESK